MAYKTTGVLAVGLIGLLLSTLGCCEPEQKRIMELEKQYNDLGNQNRDLRDQLAQSKSREAGLVDELGAANARIAELQRGPTTKPQPAGPAAGTGRWEIGLVGDRLTLASDILFASGKAELTHAGLAELDKVVAQLKSQYAGMPVRVYGYTDTDPILKTKKLWQDNLDLSANRAMTVTRHLRSKGIRADMIETIAMGETRAAAANTSTAGKAKNRRVEIIVIKSAAAR